METIGNIVNLGSSMETNLPAETPAKLPRQYLVMGGLAALGLFAWKKLRIHPALAFAPLAVVLFQAYAWSKVR